MNSQFCTRCGARLAPKAHFCKSCGTAVSARIKQKSSRRRTKLRKQPPWLLLILIIGGALIILVVLLYQSVPPAVVDVPDEHDASGLPYPNISRISVTETKERIDNGTAIIVDVRGAQEYAEAHIPNALSIPLDELQLRYQELAPNTEIITYCTWPSEESSARAAAILEELGYTNVKAIRGGLTAWQESGYPSTSGSS